MTPTEKSQLTTEEHKIRHLQLHKCLDELIADFIRWTDKLPSQTTLIELMKWSNEQTQKPTEEKHGND